MSASRQPRRTWVVASIPLLAVLLLGVLLFTVRSGGNQSLASSSTGSASMEERVAESTGPPTVAPPTAAPPTVAPPTTNTPVETVTIASPVVEDGASTAPIAMSAEIVALVGAETLTLDDLNTAAAIDAVMAGMAAQPPTEAAQLVEQAVNTAVVLQQPDVDVDLERAFVALEAFLAAHDQEYGDLAVALASSGINQDRFNRYFAQLVAADAYLRQQQSVTGASADMLVRRWQQDTRISFGPAAATFLAVAGVAPQVGSPVAEAGQNVEPLAPTEPASGVPIDEAPIAVDDELRGNEIGQIAPEFDLAELNRTFGEDAVNVHLRNFSDAPVVLIFWTTWCPYCLRQTPVLVEAHRQWAEQGIQFVGINVKEDAGVVEPYVAQHGITYPILLDEQGATAAVYAVQGYPTTFFLDSDHRIVARHVGALTEEQLNTYLVTLRSVE